MKIKQLARTMILAAAAMLGIALVRAQITGGFRWDGPLSRVITPNGDGINDKAFFCFDNFALSDVSGTIYTLLGAQVASLQPPLNASSFPNNGCLQFHGNKEQFSTWDPLSQGQVHSGVYVYQVRSEGKAYSGTILVVR